MTPAIICCAGRAKRFQKKDTPKQLLRIDGVPLLQRTVDQCIERNMLPIIVCHTHDLDSVERAPRLYAGGRWLAETIRLTSPFWLGDKVAILLGDVYYTGNTMDLIAEEHDPMPPIFFHDTQDRFAFVFPAADANIIYDALSRILKTCQQGVCHGQLADLMQKIPHDEVLIDDETSDFDTELDYQLFIAGRPKNKLWREKHAA